MFLYLTFDSAEITAQERPIAVIEGVLDVHDMPDSTSIYIGQNAGIKASATIKGNTTLGTNAGKSLTSGSRNTYIGRQAGEMDSIGRNNTFIGQYAGRQFTTGFSNTFSGSYAGRQFTTGFSNTFIGSSAGSDLKEGFYNTFIGVDAGEQVESGSNNVFIGLESGPLSLTEVSDRLYVNVFASDNPLLYGEFDNDLIRVNGDFQVKTGSTNILDIGNTNDSAGYYWSETDAEKAFGLLYDGSGNSGNNKLHLREFFGSQSDMVTFKGNGSVGIGQTNPEVPLHVNGGFDASVTGGGYILTGSSSTKNVAIDDDEIMARDNGNRSKLFVNLGTGLNGQEGGTIHFGGKLVVGNSNTGDGPGQLRYNLTNQDFEGRNETEWCSLTRNSKVQTLNIGPGAWATSGVNHANMVVEILASGATRSSSAGSNISGLYMPIQLPAGTKILEVSYYYKNAQPMQPALEFEMVGFHINGDPSLRTESHLASGTFGVGSQTKNVVQDLVLDSDKMYTIWVRTLYNASVDYTSQVQVLGVQIKYISP